MLFSNDDTVTKRSVGLRSDLHKVLHLSERNNYLYTSSLVTYLQEYTSPHT